MKFIMVFKYAMIALFSNSFKENQHLRINWASKSQPHYDDLVLENGWWWWFVVVIRPAWWKGEKVGLSCM